MPLYIEGMEIRTSNEGFAAIRQVTLDLVSPTKSAAEAMLQLGIELRPSRRSLIEQHRCFPRGRHFDEDPLEVKAWQQPRRLWPRWCRGEWEHAEQRARGER